MSIFQTREYLDLFASHFAKDDSLIGEDIFEILPDKKALLLGMKPVLNNQEITDYGDIPHPSKETVTTYFENLKTKYGVTSVQFDYVGESSRLFKVLSEMSSVPPIQQEVSPSVLLPSSWEEYLESLERTDRKELKRKYKRLDTIFHNFRCIDTSKIDMFEEFVRLHRLSDASKNQFMTQQMKAFFKELFSLQIPGWQQKLAFLSIKDKPVASVFYFENERAVLLYNSGYDPEQKYYSAGLLLTAYLIRKSIENHKEKFDFLRGSERYKYDLGGKDERLYQFIFHFTKSTSA